MLDFNQLIALAQAVPEAAQNAGGFFSNLDLQSVSSGGSAVALGVVWYFFRVIRKIVTALITVCVFYLVLRLTGNVDIVQIFHSIGGLFGGANP